MPQNKPQLEDLFTNGKLIAKGYELPSLNPCKPGMERIPKHGHHHPCYICERHVKFESHWTIEVVAGGGHVASQSHEGLTDRDDGGYMGCFPVGPQCSKLFPKDALFRSDSSWILSRLTKKETGNG
tara:strand:+ start:314 stop:691 length:378 start_codon:yes stop_codon:yes gene_type:complete